MTNSEVICAWLKERPGNARNLYTGAGVLYSYDEPVGLCSTAKGEVEIADETFYSTSAKKQIRLAKRLAHVLGFQIIEKVRHGSHL